MEKKDRTQYFKEYYQRNKERQRISVRDWRKRNSEKVKEHNRKANKKRYLKSPEKVVKANLFWRKRNPKKYGERHNALAKSYAKKYPEKIKARNLANRKLKHLKKKGHEFHHEDYSKPLEVIILPKKEHKLNHRRNI